MFYAQNINANECIPILKENSFPAETLVQAEAIFKANFPEGEGYILTGEEELAENTGTYNETGESKAWGEW